MASYEETYRRSIEDPEGFWREAARDIAWERAPERVLDTSREPFVTWFPDGRLNTAYNCLDRHVEEGHGTGRPWSTTRRSRTRSGSYTYREAVRETGAAGGRPPAPWGGAEATMSRIYMPMVPEAVWGNWPGARLGAIHSVVFGAAPRELAVRIDDATPR